MKRLKQIVLTSIVVACLALSATADEILTKAGKKLVGKIVEETRSYVKIKTKFGGVIKVNRSEIDSMVRKKSKADEYKERLAKISSKDTKALWELALWCKMEGLGGNYRATLMKILAAEPNHEEAHKALGHVRHQGRWITQQEFDKLQRAAQEKEMKDKGMVRYKGHWVTPEDRDRMEKGLVQYEGKWITREEQKYLEKGYVRYEGEWISREEKEAREKGLYRVGRKWVTEGKADEFHSDWETPWVIKGDGIDLRSNAPIRYLKTQKENIRLAYDHMKKFCLGKKPAGDIPIWLFKTIRGYNDVQLLVQSDNMYYPNHTHSMGAGYKFTEPAAMVTYQIPTKFYQYLFIGHGLGEAYLWRLFGLEKFNDTNLWFLLAPGHYFGFVQFGKVAFNMSYVKQMLQDNVLPLTTLLDNQELSDNAQWNERFYYQGAVLIYMLYKDPRFAEDFKKVREDIFMNKVKPTNALKKHFDMKVLDKAMRDLIASGEPLRDEVREP